MFVVVSDPDVKTDNAKGLQIANIGKRTVTDGKTTEFEQAAKQNRIIIVANNVNAAPVEFHQEIRLDIFFENLGLTVANFFVVADKHCAISKRRFVVDCMEHASDPQTII